MSRAKWKKVIIFVVDSELTIKPIMNQNEAF